MTNLFRAGTALVLVFLFSGEIALGKDPPPIDPTALITPSDDGGQCLDPGVYVDDGSCTASVTDASLIWNGSYKNAELVPLGCTLCNSDESNCQSVLMRAPLVNGQCPSDLNDGNLAVKDGSFAITVPTDEGGCYYVQAGTETSSGYVVPPQPGDYP